MRTLLPYGAQEWRLIALGFAAAVSQAVLLREAMAALGGSELAWGAVLTVWLVAMAAGAKAGVRFFGSKVAMFSPVLTLLLAGCGLVIMRALPALVGSSPGEHITSWRGLVFWVVAVGLPAFAGGLGFPVLAGGLHVASAAGRAYGLESAGAVIGGLVFTFLLARLGGVVTLCLTTAWVVAWIGLTSPRRLLFLGIAVPFIIIAPFVDNLIAHAGWRWSGRVGNLLSWRETREQRIELASGQPAAIYADSRLLASIPDPYRVVPAMHLAMLLHPHPAHVLLIGGLVDGGCATMLRHPVERVQIVEEDAGLVQASGDLLGAAWQYSTAEARVRVVVGEPLRALAGEKPWELVVLADGDPATLRRNRTRTVEFFRLVAERMADDGVLVTRIGVGDTYLAGIGGELVATMASTLRATFPVVKALPGEQIILVASKSTSFMIDRDVLRQRWQTRGLTDQYFVPEMIDLSLDQGRRVVLELFVAASTAPVNSAASPRAVALTVMLQEGRGLAGLVTWGRWALERSVALMLGGGVLALIVFTWRRWRRAQVAIDIGFAIGFAGVGWWLALLAAWQTTVGSVYAEIGALSALFMIGIVGGSLLAQKCRYPPLGMQAGVLACGALVSLCLVVGLPFVWPRVVVPTLLLVSGALAGVGFAAIAVVISQDPRIASGRAFSADELGGACGALVLGLMVLPWMGLAQVGWVLLSGQMMLFVWVALFSPRA